MQSNVINNTPAVQFMMSEPQYEVYRARTPLILDMAGQGSGKTEMIGFMSAMMANYFPKIKGFIGANTYMQLSQSTLEKTLAAWLKYFGWDEYNAKENPNGFYVTDRKPPAHFKKFHKLKRYNNTISLKNGCLIYVGSLDNYLAHDGKEFGWAHLDEVKDAKKEALTDVILARLRQLGVYFNPSSNNELVYTENRDEAKAKGYVAFNPCYVHTSPSYSGVEWLLELFKINDKEAEIKATLNDLYKFYVNVTENTTAILYQTHWNSYIDESYIRNARLRMSDETFDMYIKSIPFVKTGNEFYNEFRSSKHVVPYIAPDFNKRFHVTYDFNVMPYVTQIVCQVDTVFKWYNKTTGEKVDFLEDFHTGFEPIEVTRVKVIKEFCMEPPYNETEQAAEMFGQWLKANNANCDIMIYGDGSGHNRITGMPSKTQYKIIKSILSKYYINEVAAKKSNVAVLMRRKFINKLFAGKFPTLEIYIDASCKKTIEDLETVKQDNKGKIKEKAIDPITKSPFEKVGHTSDALDCFLTEIFKGFLKHVD